MTDATEAEKLVERLRQEIEEYQAVSSIILDARLDTRWEAAALIEDQAADKSPRSPSRTRARNRTMTLLELADRCEAATGPDHNLDAMIHARDGIEGIGYSSAAPAYTASLNAAMTLVPEGMNWMAGNRNQPLARAYVENGELHFLGGQAKNPALRWHECVAATPALALCAAALRALAATTEPNDD